MAVSVESRSRAESGLSGMDQPEPRTEADEEFLREHSSAVFGRIRRMLGAAAGDVMSAVGDMVSGVGRRRAAPPGAECSHHLSSETVAHTEIVVTSETCPRCGGKMERHHLQTKTAEQAIEATGSLAACPICTPQHWLFRSNMPSVRAGRVRDRTIRL